MRQIGKKRRHRSTTQGFAHDNVPMFVDAMNLKHVLRQVQAYANDLHDDSPSLQFTSDIRPSWKGGVHTIGSELARTFFTPAGWSVQPCVRPFGAVHMTAGHNALRGSGPGQNRAFKDAVALMGCPDRRIDRLCITCCSSSQPSHHTGSV
jgi:hypothetical protein